MTRQEIPVFKTREENVAYMNETLPIQESFDLIQRDLLIGGRVSSFYFVNGFTSEETMLKIMDALLKVKEEEMPEDVWEFANACIPYVEVEVLFDFDQILKSLLSGETCVFIDGYRACIVIDCRTYPVRSVEEPDKDKSLRGSRDGFVETLVYNTAMMRRRIRHPALIMEMMEVGDSSRTDVALCYMGDRVDKELLKNVRDKIRSVDTDDLRMNQQSLAECLFRRKWYNPFPKFKFSERPDTAAASILEGNIIILVDNSPACMILPSSVFDIIEEADDYYFPPVTGTYLRVTRFVIALLTLLLPPTWLLFLQNPQWIPPQFAFIKISGDVYVPVFAQLLILEFAIDGLKLAAINTPGMLTTPLSVIAGLVVGEFAVQSGWFNAETMLYMAFVAIANYTQASYELGYALKFMRILLLILTAVFGLAGYAAGLVITFLSLLLNRTVSGESYLYPLIPFDGKQFCRRIFRKRIRFDINLKE